MSKDEALAFLEGAPLLRFATTTPEGRPVLRAMNFALVEERVYFHGAPVGEKTLTVGREAVLEADETVAFLPSWFVDPERACPATTYYRSVQVHGVLEREDDPSRKARALAALLAKHQPEGRHVPLDAEHPLYEKALAGVLVVSIATDVMRGKAKLGQHKTPGERRRILEGLWRRGEPGDARACTLILEANRGTTLPEFLALPSRLEGLELVPYLCAERDVRAATSLLAPLYWNEGRFDAPLLARAHRASPAWVGVRDAKGELVATARATGDGAKHAWIYDVAVEDDLRGTGVGLAMMRLLLDHPAVRHAAFVHLGTRDAQAFYERLGFRDVTTLPPRPYTTTTMTLARGA